MVTTEVPEELRSIFGDPISTHTGKNNGKTYYLYFHHNDPEQFTIRAFETGNSYYRLVGEYAATVDNGGVGNLAGYLDLNELDIDNSILYISDLEINFNKDKNQGLSSALLEHLIAGLSKEAWRGKITHVVCFTSQGLRGMRSKYEELGYRDIPEINSTAKPLWAVGLYKWMFKEYHK